MTPPASPPPRLIALDWGTSALRAWLLAADGTVLASRDSQDGIMAIPSGQFRAGFETLCADWLRATPSLPVIASGMIGSRQGWQEAPYLPAPCQRLDLARHLLTLDNAAGRVFRIIPGLSLQTPQGAFDVMRGEETQVYGWLAEQQAAGPQTLILPGTHSKWVAVDAQGTITRFRTWMTGELYAVLLKHSILGRLAPSSPSNPEDPALLSAFADGVLCAQRNPGQFASLLFSARTLALFDKLSAPQVPVYLSGLLIGAEILEALAHFPPAGIAPALIAQPALAQRYAQAFQCLGLSAHPASPEATVRGLYAIASDAALMASHSSS